MTEVEKLNAYIVRLQSKIGCLENRLPNAALEEKVRILEEMQVLNKFLVGGFESLVMHYKAGSARNQKQSEDLWAKKAFLHNAFHHLKSKNPDAIAALAVSSGLSQRDKHWATWAESAWHTVSGAEALRKAVYRFAKQRKNWM